MKESFDSIAEAKRRLPIVPDVWTRLRLPDQVPRLGRKFASPFRPDRSPSCVLYDGRDGCQRFADKSRGIDVDAIGFLALAAGVEKRKACRRFVQFASGVSGVAPASGFAPRPKGSESVRDKPRLPDDLHRGTGRELRALASLRGLPVAGLKLAATRGQATERMCVQSSTEIHCSTASILQGGAA